MPERKPRRAAAVPSTFPVNEDELELIDRAIAEDEGEGDWTTRWIVPARVPATAVITARAEGVVAGLGIASTVFMRLDPRTEVTTDLKVGDRVQAGDVVCTVRGSARTLLTGERTALNFLQRLSGIATLTRRYVDALEGTGVRILDTRKTTPGWRTLEKAAVRAGGGHNHRFGLYDMVLVKENHLEMAGGVVEALRRIRLENSAGLPVEVEVRNKDELKAALESGCDRVLLDNMDVQAIREAVRIVRQRSQDVEIEASGNMTLERVRAVAEAGVDFISVGALTHSATALDMSLQLRSD